MPWVSGVALKPEERQSILAKRAQEAAVLAERRNDLRANTSMPLVFLDVSIKGQSLGRMEFVRCLSETPNQAHDDVSMPSMTTAGFFRSYLRKKHHLQLRTFASSAPVRLELCRRADSELARRIISKCARFCCGSQP